MVLKNKHVLRMYGLSGNNYRVATLSNLKIKSLKTERGIRHSAKK